jgi:hypothetical protein
MKTLFVSHVQEDEVLALALANELGLAGYSTWCYESDSLPGTSYLLNTRAGIDACKAFVLLVSAHSMGSHQVDVEVERAHELARPIIPVLFEVTDADYKKRKPLWAQIIGTATSVAVDLNSVRSVARRIAAGLGALSVQPAVMPTPQSIGDKPTTAKTTATPLDSQLSGADAGAKRLKPCAMAFMSVACLSVLLQCFGLFGYANPARIAMEGDTVALALIAFCLPCSFLAAWAGINMLRFKRYRLCVVAAWLFIPGTLILVFAGLPFSIWALLTLRRPDVRAGFERATI